MKANQFSAWVFILCCVIVTHSSAQEAKLGDDAKKIEYTVRLLAKVEGDRFTGVECNGGANVHLLPGDEITITQQGDAEKQVEKWSCNFTWKHNRKSGKKTIEITSHLENSKVWQAKWGVDMRGEVLVGRRKDDGTVQGKKVNFDDGPTSVTVTVPVPVFQPHVTVDDKPNREVPRPAQAPASASKSATTVKALVTDGEEIGQLVIKVTKRPSA